MCKNILVVDDHPLIIEGIKLMLNDYDEYHITSSFNDLNELTVGEPSPSIDIVILDLNVKGKNSLNEFQKIKSLYSQAKFIAFTSYDTPSLKEECRKLGIEGYILKDTTKDEFISCLSEITTGNSYYQIEKELPPTPFNNISSNVEKISNKYNLSNRETDILKLLTQGDTEQDIADKFFLSKHTVHSHNKNLKKKLKVSNIVQMMKLVYSDKIP